MQAHKGFFIYKNSTKQVEKLFFPELFSLGSIEGKRTEVSFTTRWRRIPDLSLSVSCIKTRI
jgi:hypothetical protein